MLEVGLNCGLETVGEAYCNYFNHYDLFFKISEYKEQHIEFRKELEELNILEGTESIESALRKIN